MTTGSRASRAEWQKRIERWVDSGLSAEQFASELGLNLGTLRYWKYQLGKSAARQDSAPLKPKPKSVGFVEVKSAVASTTSSAGASSAFELKMGERVLRIPPAFDSEALSRLLAVLERA